MKKKTYLDIIDPIHDFIQVSHSETKVIDNPIFQRLRRIKQLSGAYLTYPGARHTRFEHSLGVMHITNQAGLTLQEKGFLKSSDIPDLRLAGLLHDIGHGPFSHLFEEILMERKKITHEEIGKNIILKSEMGDLITKLGYDKKLITKLAFGHHKFQFMNEIISGILSADMMDYLLRDGYFTGAEHAKVDQKRITRSLDVYHKKLGLERSTLYSFESMMHSRHQMFKAVYFHKSVRSAEVMLLEAMRLADDELGFTSQDQAGYLKLTDDTVIAKLLALPDSRPNLKRAKAFTQDYLDRRLLKCAYERILTEKHNLAKINTKEIREDIAKKSRVDEDDIFIDSSTTPSIPLSPSKKESQIIILTSMEGGSHHAKEMRLSKIPLISTLSGFMNILRVYTTHKNRNRVENATRLVLGRIK
jgi:HD superfamily phosphohydrolase